MKLQTIQKHLEEYGLKLEVSEIKEALTTRGETEQDYPSKSAVKRLYDSLSGDKPEEDTNTLATINPLEAQLEQLTKDQIMTDTNALANVSSSALETATNTPTSGLSSYDVTALETKATTEANSLCGDLQEVEDLLVEGIEYRFNQTEKRLQQTIDTGLARLMTRSYKPSFDGLSALKQLAQNLKK